MPGLGATDPADLEAQARAELGFSLSLSRSRIFPNWRVVNIRDGGGHVDDDSDDDDVIGLHSTPPFCYRISDGIVPSSTMVAPWSECAYRSSLDLYDKMMMMRSPGTPCSVDDDVCGGGKDIACITKRALEDIASIYRLYGPQCTIGSYNGGKDAVIVLHLMRAAHANYCRTTIRGGGGTGKEGNIPRPRVIYFQHADEFPEVLSLLHDTITRIDLDMLVFEEGVGYIDGLGESADVGGGNTPTTTTTTTTQQRAHPLAFILGTRKDNPNAGTQGVYAPSSLYMPLFLQCNPIIDWDYGKVWEFLRHKDLLEDVPYCSLYDGGYTSLGTVKDTLPCPALKKEVGEEYWPAYMLNDWSLERAGRIDKTPGVATVAIASSIVKSMTTEATMLAVTKYVGFKTEKENATLRDSRSTVFLDDEAKVLTMMERAATQSPSLELDCSNNDLLSNIYEMTN